MRKRDSRVGVVCVVPEPEDAELLTLVGKTVAITAPSGAVVFAEVRLVACVEDFGIDFRPKRRK